MTFRYYWSAIRLSQSLRGKYMKTTLRAAQFSFLLGLIALTSACVVHETTHETTREGYYDRENHRYYHEHAWHACTPDDNYCR